MVNKAGETLDVEVIGLPNLWKGEPAYLSFIRDRTREKRLEEELQRFRQLQSLGTLAGGMAHDFNNILMVIQSTASLIIDDLDEDHPHRRDLEVIQSHVNSGANMTHRLLDYSRQRNSVTETLDLKAIVEQTVSTFAKTAKGIIVHTDRPDDECWISANRSDIEQVLLNLFSNASDAMSQSGELRIVLSVVRSSTDEPHMPRLPYAHLSITDSGCGMDSQTLARIFEPFFTTKAMGDGTGLGLSSVYGVK
ncbi:MAG: ATP-binding protein [Gammaproteobacteria bacterium]|nr:ATP-binding protein [Gammaproteobacteria bacterium]